MEATKPPWTESACAMGVDTCTPTHSRRTVCCSCRPLCLSCLSASTATTTYVHRSTFNSSSCNRRLQYIADKLLEINERGFYVDPNSIPASDPNRSTKLLAQEEDIFQTARLINCAWFGSAIFSDYFSAILGLVRDGNSWSLNPFGVSKTPSALVAHIFMFYANRKSERWTIRSSSGDAVT